MNDRYTEFIHQAIQQTEYTSEGFDIQQLTIPLQGYTLEEICNDRDLLELLYDHLKTVFPFLHELRFYPNKQVEVDEVQIIARVLRTLINSIDGFLQDTQKSYAVIICVFLIAHYVKGDSNLWRDLNIQCPLNNNLVEFVVSGISQPDLIMANIPDPKIFEKELLEKYETGLREQNLEEIYSVFDIFLRAIPLDSIIWVEESVRFLFWVDLHRLISIFETQTSLMQIYYFLQGLTSKEKLEICVEISNSLVQFECIRQVVIDDREVELTPDLVTLLSQCIVRLAQSPGDTWQQFSSYFSPLRPSSRYDRLQKALGSALALIDEEKIREYIDTLQINIFDDDSQRFIGCVNSFLENAEQGKLSLLRELILIKWNAFIEAGLKSEYKTHQIFRTSFFSVAIYCISEELTQAKMVDEIRKLVRNLNSTNSIWFSDKVLQISYFHVLISKLLVIILAWKHCEYSIQEYPDLVIDLRDFFSNNYLFTLQSLLKDSLNTLNLMKSDLGLDS